MPLTLVNREALPQPSLWDQFLRFFSRSQPVSVPSSSGFIVQLTQKPAAFMAALAIELALIWAIIIWFGHDGALPNIGEEAIPSVVFIPDTQEENPAADTPDQPSNEVAISDSMAESPLPDPTPPQQWHMEPLPIKRTAGLSSASREASSAPAAGSGIGTGGVYDPYAGAAMLPLARDPASAADIPGLTVDWASGDPGINRSAFLSWLAKLRQRLPMARGSAKIVVILQDNGHIADVRITSQNMLPQVESFIARHAKAELDVARGLFRMQSENRMHLPEFSLG